MEWSKDKTQAAESIKWRPQQAYGSNQFLLVQPQTVFSTHTKSSRSRIDKRTARATGNTRYRYSKIAPLDHKMADNCVSLARTNTLSSTITKLIKTSKTSNKSYSYSLLICINKMYTHDLFYLQQEWEAWLAPVYMWASALCTFYNNPAPLNGSMQFHNWTLVTREPEQTTLLFWSAACAVTPHGLHTADRR